MTMATIDGLLDDTYRALDRLRRAYEAVWRQHETQDPALAELASWLAARERRTLAALAGYRAEHDTAVLDVHVRFGLGFPIRADELTLAPDPTLDALIGVADRSDELLTKLGERIRVYAVGGRLLAMLESLDEHISARRRELSSVLAELEGHRPSRPDQAD